MDVVKPPSLQNISEVRHFFRTNEVPIYVVGVAALVLLGLDRWVRNVVYVLHHDPWHGAHPQVFAPQVDRPPQELRHCLESVANWLLCHPEVRALMARGVGGGVRPKVVMEFCNAQSEAICAEFGYDLILPPASLRERLDSKLVATRLGNQVGVPSVPNVLIRVNSFEALTVAARQAGLGAELVVQQPYGHTGSTTYFLSSEADWQQYAEHIVGHNVKIMRRIKNRAVAVEAVLTRRGIVISPVMSELVGYPELTLDRGGWCGNEIYPTVLTPVQREKALNYVRRLGLCLSREGYRGVFGVDFLIDVDTDELYLGEINPRISACATILHVSAGAYADLPLFLFHLLEYLDVDFALDIEEINQRWQQLAAEDIWSQMFIRETADVVERLVATAPTGHYSCDGNGVPVYRGAGLDWYQLRDETEAFFLATSQVGDRCAPGTALGKIVTRGRLQQNAERGGWELTMRARRFIESIRAQFAGTPWDEPELGPAPSMVGCQ